MTQYGSFINHYYDGGRPFRALKDEAEHEALFNSGTTPELGVDYVLDEKGDIYVPLVPEVGMGATVLYWSDRRACTISYVSPNGKTIRVQGDKATRIDSHGMSDAQSYEYERCPDAPEQTYTLRQNGRWILKGDSLRSGQSLRIGIRDEYYDYSF